MSDRNIDELMDELYHLVDKAWRLPMSGGRTVVDGGEVRTILDELRENLPKRPDKPGRLSRIALKSLRMPSEKRKELYALQKSEPRR